MITLCLDTSYQHLVIAIYRGETLIASYEEVCERKQSEKIFPILIDLLHKNDIDKNHINQIVITKGPGSYTGVRIAMTIAKIMGSLKNIPIYTISTLQLYKLFDYTVIDAKGGKVFIGGDVDSIMSIEEAKLLVKNAQVTGDTLLVDKPPITFSIAEAFYIRKNAWEKVLDIDALVPTYLKEAI